jgi:hypothetical protein
MPENASQPPSYSPEVLARIQEAFDDVWSALYANIPEDSHSAQLRATRESAFGARKPGHNLPARATTQSARVDGARS